MFNQLALNLESNNYLEKEFNKQLVLLLNYLSENRNILVSLFNLVSEH